MKTKFYTFGQNNSDGFFVNSDLEGISEYVIIEATDAQTANDKAESIGLYFNGCDDGRDCSCCGDRWYSTDNDDGEEVPSIYGKPLENMEKSGYRNNCFVHYLDGTFKKIEFKDKNK